MPGGVPQAMVQLKLNYHRVVTHRIHIALERFIIIIILITIINIINIIIALISGQGLRYPTFGWPRLYKDDTAWLCVPPQAPRTAQSKILGGASRHPSQHHAGASRPRTWDLLNAMNRGLSDVRA